MNPKPSYRTIFDDVESARHFVGRPRPRPRFQREGFNVGFAKPVADEAYPDGLDRSAHFARTLLGLKTPDPIPAERAEEMIRSGNLFTLLEEIVALVEEARGDNSIVIVEGLLPSTTHPLTADIDIAMGHSLSAEIVPVVPGLDATVKSIVGDVADAQRFDRGPSVRRPDRRSRPRWRRQGRGTGAALKAAKSARPFWPSRPMSRRSTRPASSMWPAISVSASCVPATSRRPAS